MKAYIDQTDGLEMVGNVYPAGVSDVSGQELYAGPDPLGWAMSELPAGKVTVQRGLYAPAKVTKALPARHFVGRDEPTIMAGHGGADAIFYQANQPNAQRFTGFGIEPGSRAGITTYDNGSADAIFRIDLEDCCIDGGYEHDEATGRDSKWGMIPHRWAGFVRRCVFRNIKREHGIYVHSAAGELYVHKTRFSRCGRTGFQHVGREHESGFSEFGITITDSTFEDCGLWDGGANVTAQGIKRVSLIRCRSMIGLDEAFRERYLETHPEKKGRFGTTHVVNWSEKTTHTPNENKPSDWIWLNDFAAVTAQGHGNGPAIQVTNAKMLGLSGQIVIHSGSEWNASIRTDSALDVTGIKGLELEGRLEVGVE